MNAVQRRATFLDVFAEPRQYLDTVMTQSQWAFASAMVGIFVLTTMMSTYLVLHDEGLVSEYMESVSRAPGGGLSPERLEAAKERARTALQSPGVQMYLAVRSGASKLVQLTVFWLVLGAGGALLAKVRRAFRAVLLMGGAATPILTLGATVNLLLRIGLRDLSAVVSLLPLVGPCGGRSFGCFFIGSIDVFALWYLMVVSVGLSILLHWPMARALLSVASLWAIMMISSFLTDTGAGWTL